MSQVIRKFADGGTSPKEPLLLERENVGKYNADELIKNATIGADTWLQSKGIKGAQAQGFKQNLPRFLDAIKAGKVKILADGRFDTGDTGLNSSGEYDKKKFLGIKTGIKDTENNAFNDIGAYMNSLIGKSSTYEAPTPKAKSKYSPNNYISKEISKRWYGGNPVDKKNWFENRTEQERNTLMSDIVNNADYNSMYDEYDWTDTGVDSAETLGSRLKNFGSAIGNNKLDNEDYNSFATLGGSNLDEWFKQPTKQEDTPKVNLREEYAKQLKQQAIESGLVNEKAINAFVEEKLIAQDTKEQTQIATTDKLKQRQATEAYFKDYQTKNPFTPSISGSYGGIKPNYKLEDIDTYLETNDSYLDNVLGRHMFTKTGGQNIVNNLDYVMQRDSESLVPVGEGYVAIPSTYDYNKYSAMAYNPTTKNYKEVSMLANAMLKNLVYTHYENPTKTSLLKKQYPKGMKFQEGGSFNMDRIRARGAERKAKQTEERKVVQAKAKDTNRTPEQVKAGERKIGGNNEWSPEDKIRLGSAVADVGSILTAFIPGYGTAASAVLGVGSTAGGLTADIMDDSVSTGQTIGNAAYGLGMDVIGLIPGLGATGKAGKIVKGLTKVAPKLLMAWGAYENTIPAYDALNKLMHDSGNMTVDDWKALSAGLTTIAGGTRMIAGSKALNRYAPQTTSKMVRTKSGKMVKMSTEQYDQLSHASGLESQNAVLRGIHKGEELGQAFIPRKLASRHPTLGSKPQTKTIKERNLIENPNERIGRDEAMFNSWGNTGTKINKWEQNVGDKLSSLNILPGWLKNFATTRNPNYRKPESPPEVPVAIKPETVPPVVQSSKPQPMQPKVNAEEVVAKQTISAHTPIADMFTSTRPVAGAVRANKQKRYEKLFSSLPNYQRIGGTPVEKATRPVKPTETPVGGKTYVASYRAPIPNLPAIVHKPRVQLPMLEKFLSKPQAPEIGKLVNQQMEIQSKRLAEQMVSRQTKSGKPIKSVIDANMVKRVPEHARRAKELQATFDAPVEMTRADAAPKVDNESYVSKNKAKGKTKTNSKPKKKSESKGYVNKRAQGGIIALFEDGGRPRIKAKDTSKWNRNSALAGYNWGSDVDNYLKGETGPDDGVNAYITSFNGGEDIYDQLTGKTGDYFKGKYNYSVQDPLAKQRQMTFRGTNQGFDNSIRGNIVGYGTTEGAAGFDSYAGDRTGNRTLGRGLNIDDVTRFNGQLNPRGMELYDKGNGAYRLRRYQNIAPQVNTTVEKPAPVVAATLPQELSSITAGDRVVKPKSNFSIVPEDALALGRMVSGLAINNRAAAKYKEGLKPNLMSTFENYTPVQGNFQAKNAAYGQAAELESMAARPFTSDASLQLAGQLEAGNRGKQMKMQGDAADADMFYRTRMLGQQESDAAKARRTEVGNHNMAAMNQIDAAKSQIDSARMTANYAQVLAPYLAGVENQFRQNKAVGRQVDLEAAAQGLSSQFDTNYRIAASSIQDKFNKWKETNTNGTEDQYYTGVGKDDYETLRNLQNQYRLDSLGLRKHLTSPWLFNKGIASEAKGGKLDKRDKEKIQRAKDFNKRLLADNKQFHKDIMESKREHNRLLISMSGLTSELIKRGMS